MLQPRAGPLHRGARSSNNRTKSPVSKSISTGSSVDTDIHRAGYLLVEPDFAFVVRNVLQPPGFSVPVKELANDSRGAPELACHM
jgi:hypothetical protein